MDRQLQHVARGLLHCRRFTSWRALSGWGSEVRALGHGGRLHRRGVAFRVPSAGKALS